MNILKWKTVELDETKELPLKYGCYAIVCGEVVLYIGRAKLLWKRLSNLNRHTTITKIRSLVTEPLMLAYSVDDYDNEKQLILKYQPQFNVDYLSKW